MFVVHMVQLTLSDTTTIAAVSNLHRGVSVPSRQFAMVGNVAFPMTGEKSLSSLFAWLGWIIPTLPKFQSTEYPLGPPIGLTTLS